MEGLLKQFLLSLDTKLVELRGRYVLNLRSESCIGMDLQDHAGGRCLPAPFKENAQPRPRTYKGLTMLGGGGV